MISRTILSLVFTKRTTSLVPIQLHSQFLRLPNHKSQSQPSHKCYYSKFTAVRDPVHPASPLDEESALKYIVSLSNEEREAFKTALAKYNANVLKDQFEGELAASTWRTRFANRDSIPPVGDVDPTGSYCTMPEDWLRKKLVENAKQPTREDLNRLFIVNAVPFLAFGFLDNFLMIIAGDSIEHVLGMFMCISTMAAAGLGNTISDVCGIGSTYYVERFCEVVGLRPPKLTSFQLELKTCRKWSNWGRVIGITVGCLIGMTPLMFIERKNDENTESEQKAQ